jgi:hypothetical protein
MRYSALALIFVFLLQENCVLGQLLDEKVTSQANIGMTINNLGLIGNAFRGSYTQKQFPSCEFPVGSSIEHMFQGGIWVGAYKSSRRKQANPDTSAGQPDSILVKSMLGPYVSTACFDSPVGYSTGSRNFEFTPVSNSISERSSLPQRESYRPDAISHQDLITTATDKNKFIPGTNPPLPVSEHLFPLNVDVKLESYNWNFSFANFFVILNYSIKNIGTDTLDSLHIGQYYNAVVRNVSRTAPVGTAFFNKGGNGYADSLYMGYVFDAAGDPGFTESYVGVKFLGAEKQENGRQKVFIPGKNPQSNFKVNFQTWLFGSSDPKFFPPPNDPDRYSRMSKGLNWESTWDNVPPPGESIRSVINKPGNRTNVLSVGNLKSLNPGESITVVFAVVCAKKNNEEGLPNSIDTKIQRSNLEANALWAQTAFNGNDRNGDGILSPDEDPEGGGIIKRYILPSPPDVPVTKVIAENNRISIFWKKNAESSIDPISKEVDFEGYKLYKSAFAFDIRPTIDLQNNFELVGQWDKAGNAIGFNTGFKGIALPRDTVFEGDSGRYSYGFTFPAMQNGWQHVIALTSFDRGSASNNLGQLETSQKSNQFLVFPGTRSNENLDKNAPFAYPDPYYSGAAWEGSSTRPEDRKLYFANLPQRCEVRIFTMAGDLVDVFTHDGSTYQGSEGWYKTYSKFSSDPNEPDKRVFSGGEHAWDLLSKSSQIISRGLYLFSVKDLNSGEFKTGKFTIIK